MIDPTPLLYVCYLQKQVCAIIISISQMKTLRYRKYNNEGVDREQGKWFTATATEAELTVWMRNTQSKEMRTVVTKRKEKFNTPTPDSSVQGIQYSYSSVTLMVSIFLWNSSIMGGISMTPHKISSN